MKPEKAPYYVILFALVFWGASLYNRYDKIVFDEPELFQNTSPQIEKGSTRWGHRTAGLRADLIEPGTLVRFKTRRSVRELTARVVARSGERVKIEAGKVFVDGAEGNDKYCRSHNGRDFLPEMIVPEGCLFVLNDKRYRDTCDRLDSRTLGPIPLGSVKHVFSAEPKRKRQRGGGGKRK